MVGQHEKSVRNVDLWKKKRDKNREVSIVIFKIRFITFCSSLIRILYVLSNTTTNLDICIYGRNGERRNLKVKFII